MRLVTRFKIEKNNGKHLNVDIFALPEFFLVFIFIFIFFHVHALMNSALYKLYLLNILNLLHLSCVLSFSVLTTSGNGGVLISNA